MQKNVTINDVARCCGVSKSTVSHVLSGKRRISPEVCRKVRETIEKLGYRPNLLASSLGSRNTGFVGVVCDEIDNERGIGILHELSRCLELHSFHMMVGVAGSGTDAGEKMLARFASGITDGIINTLPELSPEQAVRICRGTPVVTTEREPGADLRIDFVDYTLRALRVLWDLGHRKIGILASSSRNPGGEDFSVTAYRAFLQSHALPENRDWMVELPRDDFESGRKASELLLTRAPGLTAVLAANDQAAFGVYRFAKDHNILIPGDLSVVGFNDIPMASLIVPSLTTGPFPKEEVARTAVETLMDKMCGRERSKIQTPIRIPLKIRESTGPVRGL